jgi:hypothetical protein
MSNLADAVQAAMFTRLAAGVTLGTAYTVVPDAVDPPLVVIGDSQAEQIGGKASDAERHDVPVRCIVTGTSKRALFALMQQAKTALHNQPLTAAGFSLSRAVMTGSNDYRDAETGLLVGILNFSVVVQPA